MHAKGDKRFAFEVEQVLLRDGCAGTEVASAHHVTKLFADQLVVLGDVVAALHAVRTYVHNTESFLAGDGDVFTLQRLGVAGLRQFNGRALGPGELVTAVHDDFVNAFSQVAQFECLVCRSGDFGLADGQEAVAQAVDAHVSVVHLVVQAQHEFFGAAAPRDEPDAKLHESDVGLGVGNDFIGVKAHLTPATQGKLVWSNDDRDARVTQAHDGVLEHPNGVVQLVVLLFHGHHKDHAHIGTGAELCSFVGYDHTPPFVVGFGEVNGLVDALEHFCTDGVHLGVEGNIEDAVAQILNGRSRIGPDRGRIG